MGVLATSSHYGPLIRMIYLMLGTVLRFLFVYFCLIMMYVAIMTSLFYTKVESYSSYALTARTMFAASLANFSFDDFTQMDFEVEIVGTILLGIYLLISVVICLNLLIALLSNIYEQITSESDAEYRAVLNNYYIKYSWDNTYGFFILLPPPLNIVNIIFMPIYFLKKDKSEEFNMKISRVFFGIYATV